MDGEASRGKVAVFEAPYDAITDSHIGILRLEEIQLAPVVACYLNSSLGQAQVERLTSGASALQIAAEDIESIEIPKRVLDAHDEISREYRSILSRYEAVSRRVRRRVCEQSVVTAELLLSSGALSERGASYLHSLNEPGGLLALLDVLKPSMF